MRRRSSLVGGVPFQGGGISASEEGKDTLANRRTSEENLELLAEQMREKQTENDARSNAIEAAAKSVVSSIPARPATRSRRGAVFIEKPKVLPGSSYITVFCTLLHYGIMAFLFMGGSFYNDKPPPFMLFIIPSVAVGAMTVVGILCLILQGNFLVRKLCEPSTGLKMSIMGIFGCGTFSLIVWAPLRNDYTQAIGFFQIGGGMVIYYLLVRRRLRFASIAFSQGGQAVSRLKALWFRIMLHAVMLLVYSVGWSIIYLQLLRMDPADGTSAGSAQNATSSAGPNAATAGINAGESLLPRFISVQIRDGYVRQAARGWMFYNLLVVSQVIKGSVWISVASSAASISYAAQHGSAVKLRTSAELNTKLRESLPSLAVSGHVSLIFASIRALCEAPRRFSKRRSGILYNLGSIMHVATRPLVSRFNLIGIVDMGTSQRNFVSASKYVWEELDQVGLQSVINDDLLFGARICSALLFASVSSLAGRILVEIFQFPQQISEEVGTMCYVMSFLIGNLGIEAGEAWAISLHLQFARGPEALYVANPRFAHALHSVLFGLKVRDKVKKKPDRKATTAESDGKLEESEGIESPRRDISRTNSLKSNG